MTPSFVGKLGNFNVFDNAFVLVTIQTFQSAVHQLIKQWRKIVVSHAKLPGPPDTTGYDFVLSLQISSLSLRASADSRYSRSLRRSC
jgi:hypothetical protein